MKTFKYDSIVNVFVIVKEQACKIFKKSSKIPLKSCYPVLLDSTSLLKLFIFGLKDVLGKYEFNFHESKLPFSNG